MKTNTTPTADQRITFLDKCFKDYEGHIVFGQPANLPIIVATLATGLSLIPLSALQLVTIPIAFGSFFTWSWGELFDGINYFRRMLGLITLVFLVSIAAYFLSIAEFTLPS